MTVQSLRPVQVDFTVKEARSIYAALDLAADVVEATPPTPGGATGPELRMLAERVLNGAVIAELERARDARG